MSGCRERDGFALARWLREQSGRVGIIMVAAGSDTVDHVVGLETGANDYIAKPFEPRELLARVKSILRRTARVPPAGPRVRIGKRVLDLERRALVDPADGTEERLTAREFDLLKIFAENPNRPLMRDWLLEVAAHRSPTRSTAPSTCALPGARLRSTPRIPRRSGPCAGSATCSSHQKPDLQARRAPSLTRSSAIFAVTPGQSNGS
jgi:hypothetical protein